MQPITHKWLKFVGGRATLVINAEVAMEILKNNIGNQSIKTAVLSQYTRDMKAGNWHTCYNPIVIGKDGTLVNGQHRLLAVCKSNTNQTFDFVLDEEMTSAKDYRGDEGIKRASSFTLDLNARAVAIAKTALVIGAGNKSPTNDETVAMWKKLEPLFNTSIGEFSHTKIISKAPIMLGVITRAATDKNFEYCRTAYKAMVNADFLNIPIYIQSLYRQLVIDNVNFDSYQLFYLTFRAFDMEKQDSTKLQVKNKEFAFLTAKDALMKLINE